MRKFDEFKTTTSNYVYRCCANHKACCSYCGLGKGCNRIKKWYFLYTKNDDTIYKKKFPSWKDMSKYKKQYQKPKIKFKENNKHYRFGEIKYFDVSW